jgi:hypothetical protein
MIKLHPIARRCAGLIGGAMALAGTCIPALLYADPVVVRGWNDLGYAWHVALLDNRNDIAGGAQGVPPAMCSIAALDGPRGAVFMHANGKWGSSSCNLATPLCPRGLSKYPRMVFRSENIKASQAFIGRPAVPWPIASSRRYPRGNGNAFPERSRQVRKSFSSPRFLR